MSTCIIRTRQDRDEYVVWESIVDAPVACGTFAEITAYLQHRASHRHDLGEALERMYRARDRGTSALWDDGLRWDQERREMYEQGGTVACEDMAELCRRLEAGEDVADLLTPLEDA